MRWREMASVLSQGLASYWLLRKVWPYFISQVKEVGYSSYRFITMCVILMNLFSPTAEVESSQHILKKKKSLSRQRSKEKVCNFIMTLEFQSQKEQPRLMPGLLPEGEGVSGTLCWPPGALATRYWSAVLGGNSWQRTLRRPLSAGLHNAALSSSYIFSCVWDEAQSRTEQRLQTSAWCFLPFSHHLNVTDVIGLRKHTLLFSSAVLVQLIFSPRWCQVCFLSL